MAALNNNKEDVMVKDGQENTSAIQQDINSKFILHLQLWSKVYTHLMTVFVTK